MRVTLLLLLFLTLSLASCSRPTETNSETSITPVESTSIASVDVVNAAPEPVTISKGKSGEARMRLSVQSGYHINANPPTFSYLKATELEIKPEPGFSVDFIIYPDPLTKKFPFSEQPLAVYEGDVIIKVMLKTSDTASSGRKNLSAVLRVQACDDRVCYAPGAKEISIPVDVE